MDPSTLQDRISRGLGAAARATGFFYDAYRPSEPGEPLAPENRFLRLPALFNARDPRFGQASSYGRPCWFGVFDSAYTRPGDYLVGPGGTFFIAAQEHLLPPLCVLTNATVTVARPAAAGKPGLNGYGGTTHAGARTPLLSGWRASLLAAGSGGTAILPSDGRPGSWAVLLPPGHCSTSPSDVRTSDVLTDDRNRTFVVATVEHTALGHRITAVQAAA